MHSSFDGEADATAREAHPRWSRRLASALLLPPSNLDFISRDFVQSNRNIQRKIAFD
jgi:hypothetical protein